MQKKIIITGGPSTGKSSIINELKSNGLTCIDEVSREVILEAREKGVEHLFITSPILFSKILLEKRIQQYQDAEKNKSRSIFFDRSIIDIVAYLNFAKTKHTIDFDTCLKDKKYDLVFICPPWKEIHKTDNERYESFEEAKLVHAELILCYESYGYTTIEIPKGNIKERTQFITNYLSLKKL